MTLQSEMVVYLGDHPDLDATHLADGFLKSKTKAALVPLLAEEFDHLSRRKVRLVEALALGSGSAGAPRRVTTADAVRTALGGLVELLDQPYRVGDGHTRRGGEMTERDWLTRKAMLMAQRQGIERAVAVCDQAIEAIRRAGVETLGQIKPDGLAQAA